MTDGSSSNRHWAAAAIGVGKDLVALLRDAALFVLAALLVAFPSQLNSILVDAGFEEGSVVGFKWKANLLESNKALEEAQGAIARLQTENEQLFKALNEANAKLGDPSQLEKLESLEEESKKLKAATVIVQSTVSDSIEANAPLVEKAMASSRASSVQRGKSEYLVGLQTVGVTDDERLKLNERIRFDGYGLNTLTWSYPADQKPDWFASRSTVFYYASSSKQAAENLAAFMNNATGQSFVVQRGAGLGVDPARRDVTLFIHYVRG